MGPISSLVPSIARLVPCMAALMVRLWGRRHCLECHKPHSGSSAQGNPPEEPGCVVGDDPFRLLRSMAASEARGVATGG